MYIVTEEFLKEEDPDYFYPLLIFLQPIHGSKDLAEKVSLHEKDHLILSLE